MEAVGNVALIIGVLILLALAYAIARDHWNADRIPPREEPPTNMLLAGGFPLTICALERLDHTVGAMLISSDESVDLVNRLRRIIGLPTVSGSDYVHVTLREIEDALGSRIAQSRLDFYLSKEVSKYERPRQER